jgi:hypothetical protein
MGVVLRFLTAIGLSTPWSMCRTSAPPQRKVPCDPTALAPFSDPGLDTLAGFGGAMKLRQPREAMPLTVLIAFALMAIGTVVYLTGFLIIEDILAFFSARK